MNLSNRARTLDFTILLRKEKSMEKATTLKESKWKKFGAIAMRALGYAIFCTIFTAVVLGVLFYLGVNNSHASILPMPISSYLDLFKFWPQALELVKTWGGMTYALKVSAIVNVIVASTKLGVFRPIWDKFKNVKITYKGQVSMLDCQLIFVGLITILVGVVQQGDYSFAAIVAYVISGGGSVIMHQIVDALKTVPFIKPIIEVIEKIVSVITFKPKK